MKVSYCLVVVVFATLGCLRTVPSPVEPVSVNVSTVVPLLEQLHREAQEVRRYRSMLRIRGKGPEGAFRGRLVAIFERPQNLRMELLGMFGSTRWSAVTTDRGIQVLFPGPSQFVDEVDTPDIVGRLIGIRLSAEEIIAVLSGIGSTVAPIVFDLGQQLGSTRVLFAREKEIRIEIDSDDQVSSLITPSYRVSYPSSWKVRRRQVPDRIRLETDRLSVTIDVEAADVNVALDPGAFFMAIPKAAKRLIPADIDGEAVFVVNKTSNKH